MSELTLEQQACNYKTFRHIERVRNLLNSFSLDFMFEFESSDSQSKPTDLRQLLMVFLDCAYCESVEEFEQRLEDYSNKNPLTPQILRILNQSWHPDFSNKGWDSYMIFAVKHLISRGQKHDQSKLETPEVELFAEYTPKLALCEYDSPEYHEYRNEMKIALDHHYANNSHHPEYYKDGIDDMNIFDIIEMTADWKASSERQYNGNIRKSIETNAKRFGICDMLSEIMENSIKLFERH